MTPWLKSLTSLVFLAIMLVFGYQQTQAPEARIDSDLDYGALSEHVATIAARPHPMGGEAHREVREYIVAYFKSLGLSTEVQKTTVVYRHPTRPGDRTIIGNVENIIARLPGRSGQSNDRANDLVLMAHYDSRPLTFGAADDASGTASIMEVARLMVAGPAPVHDVVFLITDGEEMGLLGAQGFFRQHPAAARVGLVLDFEARGSYGTSSMFETSDNNGWLIENLIESAPDLVASSLSYEIYRRMPNDTDMSISKGEGIPGLNFAFVSGLFDYHAMTDSPKNLDKNTLAQQANYALDTGRHFANLEEWQAGEGDVTYFNLWQGTLVNYSDGVAKVLGLLVLALGLWVFVTTARMGTFSLAALGNGILGFVVLIIIISNVFENFIDFQGTSETGIARLLSLRDLPLFAYFVTNLGICAWFSAAIRRGLNRLDVWMPALILAATGLVAGRSWMVALVLILVLVPSMMVLRSRKNDPDLWGASLLVWWLLAALALYFIPNGSYLLVWPLASVMLGFAIHRRKASVMVDVSLSVTLLSSFIPMLLLPPMVMMGYLALGSSMPQIVMSIAALSLLLIWPLVQSIGSGANGKPGLILLMAGLLMTLFVALDRDFSARYPREASLFHAVDVDRNESFWTSLEAEPGSWAGDFLGENAEVSNLTRIMPGYDKDVVIHDDGLPQIEAATLEVTGDRVVDGLREISLHLQSPSQAEYINLLFQIDVGISSAMANGFAVKVPQIATENQSASDKPDADKNLDRTNEKDWWRWRWYGMPEQGADIVLRFEPDRRMAVKIIEVDYGMPDEAPPRPDGIMARKYTWSDSRVIFRTQLIE